MCERIGELGAPLDSRRRHGVTHLQRRRARHRRDRHRARAGLRSCTAPAGAPQVVVPETRPLLQGSRLTAWELSRAGVPCTLIADGMVGEPAPPGRRRLRARRAPTASPPTATSPTRSAPTGWPSPPGRTASRSTCWPRRSTIDPATPDGARDPDRRARAEEEVTAWRGVRAAPDGVAVVESRVRCHPGRAGDRDRHRPRRVAARDSLPAHRLMPSILALDQGTTGSTALVIHQDGSVLGRGYREFTQHFPQPGWVEHDPEEILRVSLEAMREALAAAGERPVGLGITNQRETVVLWDRRTLAPVAPAIVWQDRRTSDRCRELREAGRRGRCSRERTGLVADPYFSATKLEWLLRDPELRRRAGRGRARRGYGRELAGGAAHRRPGSRERSHQREPHAALRSRRTRLGPGAARLFGVPPEVLPAHHQLLGLRGRVRPGTLGRSPCRSPGSRATSRRRCSGRAAAPRGWRRTPTAPARSCWCIAGTSVPVPPRAACSPPRPADRVESRPSRSKGACSSPGAAVQWLRDGLRIIEQRGRERRAGAQRRRHRGRGVRARVRGPGHAALGGGGAWDHHRASPAAPRGRTWCARRWRRSHSAAPTCCTP